MFDKIVFEFSKREVLQRDYERFLSMFRFQSLPKGEKLKAWQGRLVLCVTGFEEDSREFYDIPEVRNFFFTLHQTWPFSLFFCDLTHDSLKLITLCCLEKVSTVKVDGSDKVRATYDVAELMGLFPLDLFALNLVAERAGLSEQEIFERTRAVFEYWNLPFQAPPPTSHP
jgi:hypothetical protein